MTVVTSHKSTARSAPINHPGWQTVRPLIQTFAPEEQDENPRQNDKGAAGAVLAMANPNDGNPTGNGKSR